MDTINFIWHVLPFLLEACVVTIELAFGGLLLGFILGIPLAFAQVYGPQWLQWLATLYERVFRSVPLLVILLLVFFGLPAAGINLSSLWAAIVGIGLRSGAYQSQIFRGAINSVSKGQMVAARAIGMSKFQAIKSVITPQMLRFALPPWANEFTVVLKDTPLAFALGVRELLRQGWYIMYNPNSYRPMTIFIVVAFIYLVMTLIANNTLAYLERHFQIAGYGARSGRK